MNRQTNIVYQIYKPSPDLAHLVRYYFLYENKEPYWHTEFALSDGDPGISFASENASYLSFNAANEQMSASAFICGAFSRGIYVSKGVVEQKMFGVKFTVDGLYTLLREPLGSLQVSPVWKLEDVLGNHARRLAEKIGEVPEVAGQIAALESYLRSTISVSVPVESTFRQAVVLIKHARGQISIEQIVNKLSVNYKWLERKFIAYTGTTPKEYARLIRFMHTYLDFRRDLSADLMQLAINNGYYDQSHFIKEFRHFTGYTPTQLLLAPVYDLAGIIEPEAG
jgi:AraC-like DNA-binding protein